MLATHGILSADAPRQIVESPIDEVLILNQFAKINGFCTILFDILGCGDKYCSIGHAKTSVSQAEDGRHLNSISRGDT